MELRSLRSSFMATLTRLEQQVARGAVGNRSKVLQYPMVVFQYAEAQPAPGLRHHCIPNVLHLDPKAGCASAYWNTTIGYCSTFERFPTAPRATCCSKRVSVAMNEERNSINDYILITRFYN